MCKRATLHLHFIFRIVKMVNLKTTPHLAPQIAAISDPEADGSIGNVVAANAIGVFLGLGFPWLVAAVYWDQVDTILRHLNI